MVPTHKTKHLSGSDPAIIGSDPAITNSDPNFMDNITQGEDRLEDYAISESQNAYNAVFDPEKWVLRGENTVFWSDSALITNT